MICTQLTVLTHAYLCGYYHFYCSQHNYYICRYIKNKDRVANRHELLNILQNELLKQPRDYWLNLFEKTNVTVTPVNSVEEAFQEPQVSTILVLVVINFWWSCSTRMYLILCNNTQYNINFTTYLLSC